MGYEPDQESAEAGTGRITAAPLGRNVCLSNPEFRKALDTHLNLLEADIARGDIEPVVLP